MNIGIIGYGVVGRNMRLIFPEATVVDPYQRSLVGEDTDYQLQLLKHYDKPGELHYDIAFVCVPTDMLPDGSCDTSIVEKAVRENDADVFVIKSTVPPFTTESMYERTHKYCVFSPEFFGGTQHANAVDYDFVILGGDRPHVDKVAEAYKEIKPASFRIFKTTPRTAELVKYAENAFLATKVTFFAEFARLAAKVGVDVDEWRELLLLDPRIGRSHSFTYRDHPYYDSHCLNKDIPAILAFAKKSGVHMPMLTNVKWANSVAKESSQSDVTDYKGQMIV